MSQFFRNREGGEKEEIRQSLFVTSIGTFRTNVNSVNSQQSRQVSQLRTYKASQLQNPKRQGKDRSAFLSMTICKNNESISMQPKLEQKTLKMNLKSDEPSYMNQFTNMYDQPQNSSRVSSSNLKKQNYFPTQKNRFGQDQPVISQAFFQR